MSIKWEALNLHGFKSPVTNTAKYKGWILTHYTDVDDFMAHIAGTVRVIRAKSEADLIAQVEGAKPR